MPIPYSLVPIAMNTKHNSRLGKVYLVGAGTGDLEYLTIRAKELLTRAEILIYDALVDEQLLAIVPEDCLQINVGKRGNAPSTPQETINQLLVHYCLQGKQVIRLKSGDPFIFGRSREEIDTLRDADCNFEVIPGISSALVAPLLAGIPLTDKLLSSCFAVCSGHDVDLLDWDGLARIDTLVILMGGRNLESIVKKLLEKGRSRDFPVAIIKNASRQQQEIWQGTLTDIVDQTQGISLSPSVIVIGNVVNLRNLTPTTLPLTGKTVLVTRAAEQSSKFTDLLEAEGATVIEMPALEITAPSNWQELDHAIAHLSDFDWLILTSANGVNYFWQRLEASGKDSRALANVKIAVVGKKTATVLAEYGIKPDFIPPNFVADSLVANFPENLTDQNILFPRVETGGREILVTELSAQGAKVVEVPAYQSSCPAQIDQQAWLALSQGKIDIITFASSKTVQNFAKLLHQALTSQPHLSLETLLANVCIASIGPQTSQTCREIFGRVDVEAKEYTLDGLTQALIETC